MEIFYLLGGFAHVYPWSGGVRPLRYGIIDPYAFKVYLHSRALFFGYLGVLRALEIYERESSGTTGLKTERKDFF